MIVSALAEHLWQSTWFAIAAGLLTLLLRRDARMRFWVWFAASLKFLVPFSFLTLLGQQFVWQVDEQALLPLVQHAAAPLTSAVVIDELSGSTTSILMSVWMMGTLLVLSRWLVQWLRVRKLVHNSVACSLIAPLAVRCTNAIDEPAVVGILDPVLLVPTRLATHLTPAQLDCVIAHEWWHVRRRDNLTAAIHSCIQALFWFHPLTWWIGVRMVEAREHACDEGALAEGVEPHAYAESILRVCRHSVESRQLCVASATGGDLTARIRTILSGRSRSRFNVLRHGIVAGALASCVVLPVTAGIQVISTSHIHVAAGAKSIWPTRGGPSFFTAEDGFIYARNVSLRELISHTYGVDVHEVDGPLLWLDRARYDLELRMPANESKEWLVADLLKQRFNLELVVRPNPHVMRPQSGLEF
jgi:bla regulator protein blaR1